MGNGASSGQITLVIQDRDGNRTVDVSEFVKGDARPQQPFRCTLEADAEQVKCSDDNAGTDESLTLVQFLSPSLYQPSRAGGSGSWQMRVSLQGTTLEETFAVAGTRGELVTIAVSDREVSDANRLFHGHESGTLVYDAGRAIPESISLETAAMAGIGQNDGRMDLNLISNSAASPASPNPH